MPTRITGLINTLHLIHKKFSFEALVAIAVPLMAKFSSGTKFLIIFKPLGNCMIFKIKYNFVNLLDNHILI